MNGQVNWVRQGAILSIVSLLSAVGPHLGAATTESNLSKTFQVKPGGQLVIDADRGSIKIETSDRSDVAIEVKRTVLKRSAAKAAEIFEAHTVTFDQDGDHVSVKARLKEGMGGFFNRGIQDFQVEFRILTPRRFNLDLKTAAGSISSEDIEGKVKARTAGGSFKFADITGPLDAETSAGSIKAGKVSGPITAKTSGGSITLDELGADTTAHTSAGSITVHRSKARLDARTSGGSIQLGVAEGPAELETSAGSISIHLIQAALKARTGGGSITIDEAQDTVKANTSAGSITAAFSSQPKDDCELTTSGGSITVGLDPELAFDLDARANGGRVSSAVTVATPARNHGSQLSGKINGGSKKLLLRTSAGSITIRKK